MPGKRKKFIDKKHAVSFTLGSRSQHDPLLLAGGSENVLLPGQASSHSKKDRLDEQMKFGIYYDDDYDYLQHLKDVNELNDVGIVEHFHISADQPPMDTSLQLPSSVFGSAVETKVGLLNRAAPMPGPQLDWDPDIVAGLDVDFDYDNPDNILQDDFVAIAEGPLPESTNDDMNQELDGLFDDEDTATTIHCQARLPTVSEEASESDDVSSESESDTDSGSDLGSLDGGPAKSALTSYSMTSSVLPRNEKLTLLDDMFEKFAEGYCEDEIGDLSHEEIDGYLRPNSERMKMLFAQFEQQQKKITLKDLREEASGNCDPVDECSDSNDEMTEIVVEEPEEKWDCETILSTHSTLYNRPATITEETKKRGPVNPITLTKNLEIPSDVLTSRGLTRRQMEQQPNETMSSVQLPQRTKNETAEEKRARKQAVREARKERREQKTALRKAFRNEKLKHDQELINAQHNLQGINIV